MLDDLQKRVCRTDGSSFAVSLEPLIHRRTVASLSLLYIYRYYFGRSSAELTELVPLCHSRGSSTRYSNKLHNFSATIPRSHMYVYVNSLRLE